MINEASNPPAPTLASRARSFAGSQTAGALDPRPNVYGAIAVRMASSARMNTSNLRELFELSTHGTDVFVGEGMRYPWGGLYGGHIVAQALRAAAHTVDQELQPHSLRAYFIRRGDNREPVRYEVDRIRNGRSFATRRVVARQSVGAILNLEASFQREEASENIQTVSAPTNVAAPETLESNSWSKLFDRRRLPLGVLETAPGYMGTPVGAWMRVTAPLGDDPIMHHCALAYLSDGIPSEAVDRSHPVAGPRRDREEPAFHASLDHTIWFHRAFRADRWHFYRMGCHNFVGGRGLTIGHVFDEEQTHVATLAQEVLVRIPEEPSEG